MKQWSLIKTGGLSPKVRLHTHYTDSYSVLYCMHKFVHNIALYINVCILYCLHRHCMYVMYNQSINQSLDCHMPTSTRAKQPYEAQNSTQCYNTTVLCTYKPTHKTRRMIPGIPGSTPPCTFSDGPPLCGTWYSK